MGMSTTFEVVAEPSRRRILDALRTGERPVNDLVHELAMAQPAVSKHLRVLRDAGLVSVRQVAQQRIYRLQPEPLVEIDDWLTPFREAWGRRLDALEAHLDTMEEQ
jgi:DNA-binding transcriptional ArsR family regulator